LILCDAGRLGGSPLVLLSVCEEAGRNLGQGFRRDHPGRVKPKGGASDCRLKNPCGHKALLEGLKPRNRGLLGRSDASAAE
jgi:hypothetical protein